MSDLQTYSGSCHCGAVRFELHIAPPTVAYACNCSMCSRAGWLLTFANGDAFQLKSGADHLTDYQFGKKKTHHVFCKTCGVRAYSHGTDKEGKPTTAVNLRCVAGLDATKLEVHEFDGASI